MAFPPARAGRAELTALAKRLSIPVISSPNGMGCIDMADPLSLGFIGRNGAYPANQAGRHADLVLAIGARFDDRSASSWMPGYSWNFPHQKLIHVDLDHNEIGRNYSPTLGILADARAFLRQVLAELDARGVDGAPRLAPWHGSIKGWRGEWAAFIAPGFETHSSPIRPERIVADCRKVLPDDVIISLDSGIHHNWFMQFWEARRPQSMLNTWGYSGMGFGPSSILGAKLAAPDREVFVIVGDGSWLMLSSELVTAVQEGVKLIVLLWDNGGYKSIGSLSRFLGLDGFGTRYAEPRNGVLPGDSAGDDVTPVRVDFAMNARSLGADVIECATRNEYVDAIAAAKAATRTTVIVIRNDRLHSVPGYESWWDVPVPEVSERDSERAAREEYEEMRAQERLFSG